jgi:cystathionine beta-synthase
MSKTRESDVQCPYFVGMPGPHPHTTQAPRAPRPLICDSILDNIGDTPMIRCSRLMASEGIECEILAKCEFFNAGGSVKDRIGKRMVLDAEKQGRLKPGDTIIEPTSGNTGIGLALAAAVRGYKVIITMPEKMSLEKRDILTALGAQIIRTPTEAASSAPDSHINVAARLNASIPNSHILDQYINPSNPLAHYEGTAEEIWEQCGGKLDMIVMASGTGGTITGTARRLKELDPTIQIVGVDPFGSILAQPPAMNETDVDSYEIEGIGYDFIPRVFDRSIVDIWMKSEDKPSFLMSRKLIAVEGFLCGGSSGSAMVAALECARKLGAGKRLVVLLPDGVRNYMTKFLSDSWMYEHGFLDEYAVLEKAKATWWSSSCIANLELSTPITITPDLTCKEAIDVLHANNFDMVPVQSEHGKIEGVVTEGNLTSYITQGRVAPDDLCTKAMFKHFRKVTMQTNLAELSVIFNSYPFVLVVSEQTVFNKDKTTNTRSVVSAVVSRIDLLKFIASGDGSVAPPTAGP